jgi:WS/DGAT/MGAT family acyltransferase
MQVALDMADDGPDAPWPQRIAVTEYRPPLLTRLIVPAMSAVDSTLRLGETAIRQSMGTLLRPERIRKAAGRVTEAAKLGAGYTWTLSRLGLMPFEPHTIFKGPLGVIKRVAWSRPLPLGEIKAVGKLFCGTVNDVLLAAVAGGLRRYLQGRGENTEGLNLRALVPINLRGPDECGTLGTHAGITYLSLPVGIQDAQERLAEVKKRMDAIKQSPEGRATFDMFNLVGLTPPQVTRLFCELFCAKATGVMTNVPGPRAPIYVAGRRLAHMLFWVPTAAGLSLGVGICSYNGNVIVGIQTAASLVSDPENIVSAIEADFDDMHDYVRYVREDTSSTRFRQP